ncbi:MAG: hypothetical protein QOI14_19 [Actinomycetota bacterium]|nr:hypothetical protein [Actinomycetota bacterium]
MSNDDDGESKFVGIAATLAALGAATLMRKSLEKVWMRATGKEAPVNPESSETSWGEAVAWALVSGALLGVARLVARRGAITTMSKTTNNPSLARQNA